MAQTVVDLKCLYIVVCLLLQWPCSDWWPVSCFCTVPSSWGRFEPPSEDQQKEAAREKGRTDSIAWSIYPAYGHIQLKDYQYIPLYYYIITKADNGSFKLSCVTAYSKKRKLTYYFIKADSHQTQCCRVVGLSQAHHKCACCAYFAKWPNRNSFCWWVPFSCWFGHAVSYCPARCICHCFNGFCSN